MFTADNLPEAARATDADMAQWFAIAPVRAAANQHAALVLDRLNAAHGGRLSKLLNSAAAIETARPTNLPEWAKATPDDLLLMAGKTWSNEADPLNYHAARVLARQPIPVLTDEPPEVTWEEAGNRLDVYSSFDGNPAQSMRAALAADRARVWQTHRPAPVDPVRFALEKVTEEQIAKLLSIAHGHDGHVPAAAWRSEAFPLIRAELARILPVAEQPKPWAELTDEVLGVAFEAAFGEYHAYAASVPMAAASLRANLSAYAPPPRKVEVTPEVMKAFQDAWDDSEPSWALGSEAGFGSFYQNHIDGVRAAVAVANEQAAAREIEAVAGVARLKGEVGRLTKERDDWQTKAAQEHEQGNALISDFRQELAALRAHADKLEALLTVDGVDGPVKTWKPFQRRYKIGPVGWEAAELALGYSVGGTPQALFDRVTGGIEIRQTPAPEAELKRWKIAAGDRSAFEYSTTKPMTRVDAEKVGIVIGEAVE